MEVVDATTNERISGISRISLYVNTFGKVCVDLTIKDVKLDLGVEEGNINESARRHD